MAVALLLEFPGATNDSVCLVRSMSTARSLALEAEAFLNARHQLIDTEAFVDLDGVELQRRSFFEHLFRIDRITRKYVGEGPLWIACPPRYAPCRSPAFQG